MKYDICLVKRDQLNKSVGLEKIVSTDDYERASRAIKDDTTLVLHYTAEGIADFEAKRARGAV